VMKSLTLCKQSSANMSIIAKVRAHDDKAPSFCSEVIAIMANQMAQKYVITVDVDYMLIAENLP